MNLVRALSAASSLFSGQPSNLHHGGAVRGEVDGLAQTQLDLLTSSLD